MKLLTVMTADGHYYQREFPDNARLIFHSEGYPLYITTKDDNIAYDEENWHVGRDYAVLTFQSQNTLLERTAQKNEVPLVRQTILEAIEDIEDHAYTLGKNENAAVYLKDQAGIIRAAIGKLT